MSRPRPQTLKRAKASKKPSPPDFAKQLRIAITAVLLFGIVGALVVSWEHLFPIPPARLVMLYRTHGCRCAFTLADTLEAQGFVVRLYEYETLKYVRGSLHTPANLHGCHVGAYLGYFLEGHIAPEALRKLAQQQPAALGLATEDSVRSKRAHISVAIEEQLPVLLIERDGRLRTWFEPSDPPQG